MPHAVQSAGVVAGIAALSPFAVTPGRALIVAGLLPPDHPVKQAEAVARAQISRGAFPFRVTPVSGTLARRLVLVEDVRDWLIQRAQTLEEVSEIDPPRMARRGRGRPRKETANG